MLFNSLNFFVYFAIVSSTYFLLPHRFRSIWLLLSSCYFYMAFIPYYILILFGTIVIDYFAGIAIFKTSGQTRKLVLIISIMANTSVLMIFKYYEFIIYNLKAILPQSFAAGFLLPENLGLVLPIGLSFHTFQAMSYTIEVYRGTVEAERNFVQYALYVMFFPQLVAGPIERPQNILCQLRQKHMFNYERTAHGIKLIFWGLFKKCVIADRLAKIVDFAYQNPSMASQHSSLGLATVLFGIQIYCDFSGYSDIALGTAEILGIRLMKNFRRPYFATSISDFWKRWHISLSTWFRDYLYIPLGGSRKGKVLGYRNILITFLISGLWHGAAWTYIVWGALNGLFLIAESLGLAKRFARADGPRRSASLPTFLRRFATVSVVMLTWVFFRANNLGDAIYILGHLWDRPPFKLYYFTLGGMGATALDWVVAVTSIAVLFFCEWLEEKHDGSLVELVGHLPIKQRLLVYYGFLVTLILFGLMDSEKQFIYFQF